MKQEKIINQYSDDVRLALLEQSINNINNAILGFEKRFDKIDVRFDKIDERFEKLDDKFQKIDERFEKMSDEIDSKFNKVILLIISSILLPLGFHALHWI